MGEPGVDPLINSRHDEGQTHYYGDGCDDPHGTPCHFDDDGFCHAHPMGGCQQ